MDGGSCSSLSLSLSLPPHVRHHVLELLIHSCMLLSAPPVVKYTALSFFADRFLPSLPRFLVENNGGNWLLTPLRDSNLELFALISIWVSSKIHDTSPLSVKRLKSLGDNLISDQHFTTRDFVEAELVFMEVLRFDIGASNTAFMFLDDLLIQFRELSKLGELVSYDVCMDIMDLLYETEETSMLFRFPCPVAASVLVTAYILSIPKQQWEFPILPWVKFVTSLSEEDIRDMAAYILDYVLKPEMQWKITRAVSL